MTKTRKKTTDAIIILKHRLSQDRTLATLVEEERKQLKIAEKIHEARQAAGLSQEDLAKMIGSTQSAIARLESGEYERLSISTLLKVSLALNCRLKVELAVN